MERDDKIINGLSENDRQDKKTQGEKTSESSEKLKNDTAETGATEQSTEKVGGVDVNKVCTDDEKTDKITDSANENGTTGFVKPERLFKIILTEETETEQTSESEVAAQIIHTKTKKARTVKSVIYVTGVLVVSVLLAVVILFSMSDMLGMFRSDTTADVKIPDHSSTAQIASILQKNGIIRSALVFRVYVKLTHQHSLESGIYTLNSQMSYDEIVQALKDFSNNRATVRVTIPEGYTLQSIGDLLQKDNVCTKQAFLNSASSAAIKFDFSSQIQNDADRFYRLEGYLFPDTYEFYLNQSSDAVVNKMLQNFDTRFDSTFRKETAASGMTVDQIVTLASIIQVEAGNVSEMGKVSSVFHNRLKNGINGSKLLQSDATIFYVTHDIEPVLTTSDTQLESAYNTYKHEGLPPGAICNPGLDAIKAALSPENTPYYFFVSDKNGEYYYAETYARHLLNVKKALKSGAASGTNVTK
jgi:UPF0755 protein